MRRRAVIGSAVALALAGCGGRASKFRTYDGPDVTRLFLLKGRRRLYLMHRGRTLRRYPVGLGFAPKGHKHFRGDGRTPEGRYRIDKRNPNSRYHLSLGLSYPNARDIAHARLLGRDPGSDIFIHGEAGEKPAGKRDWTAGCIAVADDDIEEIYAMVDNGTPIIVVP